MPPGFVIGVLLGVLIIPAAVVVYFGVKEARRSKSARDGFLFVIGAFARGVLVGVLATNWIRGCPC